MLIHHYRDPDFTAVPLTKSLALLFAWADGGALVMLAKHQSWALRVGWGYDEDLPLSPVPRSHTKRTAGGRWDTCYAWCGLYLGLTRVSQP